MVPTQDRNHSSQKENTLPLHGVHKTITPNLHPGSKSTLSFSTENENCITASLQVISGSHQSKDLGKVKTIFESNNLKAKQTSQRYHPYQWPVVWKRSPLETPSGIVDHGMFGSLSFDQRSVPLCVMNMRKLSNLGGPEKHDVLLCDHISKPSSMKYVLKFYSKNSERFLREMEVLRGIRHPYIFKPNSFRMVNRISFTVSNYLPNGSLASHIGNLPIVTIVTYFIKISNALSFLHSLYVYHKDLRPENILIDDRNNPRICDFDMADRLQPGKPLTNARRKTEEDVNYARYYGVKIDSYSLGAVLHCMMFEVPYHEYYDFFEQAKNAKLPPGCDFFPLLKQILVNLLTPEWRARWGPDNALGLLAKNPKLLLTFCEAQSLEEIDYIFAKAVRTRESKAASQNAMQSKSQSTKEKTDQDIRGNKSQKTDQDIRENKTQKTDQNNN